VACLKPGLFHPERGPFMHFLKRSIKNKVNNIKRDEGKIVNKRAPLNDDVGDDRFNADIEDDGEILQYFATIDDVFKHKQPRVQPYIRDLFTLKIIKVLADILDLNQNYSFIDYEMLEVYKIDKKKPTQRSIAAKINRKETDASRTLRKFMKEVKSAI
jgi:hypothetical protein